MKPSEIVDTMLTEIIPDESRWAQQTLYEPTLTNPKYCLLGALNMASSRTPMLTALEKHQTPFWEQTYQAIATQIHQLPGCSIDTLITFNDAKKRRYHEVREVLEKTRAALQEKGR